MSHNAGRIGHTTHRKHREQRATWYRSTNRRMKNRDRRMARILRGFQSAHKIVEQNGVLNFVKE